MTNPNPTIQLHDHVELRKPHPCGSTDWEIYRVGADIGLRCLGCDRRVLLPRRVFNKRLRRVITPTHERDTDDS